MSALELLRTETVALPIHSWSVDLTLEEDRPLPRLEETILRLSRAGVREFSRFVQLLGVEERQLARAFGDLRLQAALSAQAGTYEVTPEGLKLLERAALRVLRKTRVRLWHDPYTDTLNWEDLENDDVMTGNQQRESGIRALPAPVELREDELRERHREIQALLQRSGLPDDEDELESVPARHLVHIAPKGHTSMFLPVELSVHRHIGTRQLVYVLKRNGRPDQAASLTLKALNEQNVELVPFEPLRTLPPEAQRLTDRFVTLQRKGTGLEADDSRIPELLQRAVPTAQQVITLFSSFQADTPLDVGMLRTLRTRLLQTPALHARIIVTEPNDGADVPQDVRQLLTQMQTIESIRSRLRIVETHEVRAQGVVIDHAWGLIDVRQFAQHPWKTEYGLSYNRRSYVADREALKVFQASVDELLTTERTRGE